jgi:flagellin-like protein
MIRKGITPVIAVVLLLLITVGAVGAAFGLFQQLQTQAQGQTEQLDQAQRASQTNINFISTYDATSDSVGDNTTHPRNNTINFTIRNTGQRAISLPEDLDLKIKLPQEDEPLPPSSFERIHGDEWLDQPAYGDVSVYECFENTNGTPQQSLPQDEQFNCGTSVRFPNVGESITLVVDMPFTDQIDFTKTCRPQTSGATC